MNKKKAIICTLLFAVVLIVAIIGAMFVESKYVNLYELLANFAVIVWAYNQIEKFYNWLVK